MNAKNVNVSGLTGNEKSAQGSIENVKNELALNEKERIVCALSVSAKGLIEKKEYSENVWIGREWRELNLIIRQRL